MSMAPVAPMGWPRAMAPPFTLTFSGSTVVSRKNRSTTDGERLVDLEQVDVVEGHAGTSAMHSWNRRAGAVSMMSGSSPMLATADITMRARGREPVGRA